MDNLWLVYGSYMDNLWIWLLYPLVMSNIAMENHHFFYGKNSLFLWSFFHSYVCLPEGISMFTNEQQGLEFDP